MMKSSLNKLDVLDSSIAVFQVVLILEQKFPWLTSNFPRYLVARKSNEGALKDKLLKVLM